MKTALVIGGSGRTGHHIVEKLLEKGVDAHVLTRSPDAVGKRLSAAAKVAQGDITDPASLRAAVANAEGVIVVVESADSDGASNSPERVHFQGMQNVIAAAREKKSHVVLISQIYITRPERYPEARNVIYWRGQAEEALRTTSGLPYTIVRPSWLNDEPGGRHGIRFEQGTPVRVASRERMLQPYVSKCFSMRPPWVRHSRCTTKLAYLRKTGDLPFARCVQTPP